MGTSTMVKSVCTQSKNVGKNGFGGFAKTSVMHVDQDCYERMIHI